MRTSCACCDAGSPTRRPRRSGQRRAAGCGRGRAPRARPPPPPCPRRPALGGGGGGGARPPGARPRAAAAPGPAVGGWRGGGAPPSGLAAERLATLAVLLDRLEAAGMYDAEVRGEWLRCPNRAFDGTAPLDVV